MKVKEIMDKEFIAVSPDMDIVEASIKMESHKKFTTPVLDDEKHLIGWITSFGCYKGSKRQS